MKKENKLETKKNYMAPQMETVEFQYTTSLLECSILGDCTDPQTLNGGEAG